MDEEKYETKSPKKLPKFLALLGKSMKMT